MWKRSLPACPLIAVKSKPVSFPHSLKPFLDLIENLPCMSRKPHYVSNKPFSYAVGVCVASKSISTPEPNSDGGVGVSIMPPVVTTTICIINIKTLTYISQVRMRLYYEYLIFKIMYFEQRCH